MTVFAPGDIVTTNQRGLPMTELECEVVELRPAGIHNDTRQDRIVLDGYPRLGPVNGRLVDIGWTSRHFRVIGHTSTPNY
jgi:hypothetical protein